MKTIIHSQHQPGVSRSYSGISHHTPGRAADYREHLDETWRDKIVEIIWKRTELLSLAADTNKTQYFRLRLYDSDWYALLVLSEC